MLEVLSSLFVHNKYIWTAISIKAFPFGSESRSLDDDLQMASTLTNGYVCTEYPQSVSLHGVFDIKHVWFIYFFPFYLFFCFFASILIMRGSA